MSDIPKKIRINEEGPREGFQIEKGPITTEQKIALIDSLSKTGLRQIQTMSFVPPKNVPGMWDAAEVVAGFTRAPGVRYTALWLNAKGLERAIATQKLDIAGTLSLCASEPFLLRNQKRTMQENLDAQHDMVELFRQHNAPVNRAGLQAAFGCNFAGDISIPTVLDCLQKMMDIGEQYQLDLQYFSLADTMAWATPRSIKQVVGAVRNKFPDMAISLHLHDTRGMGIANAYAGLEMGVEIFDAAVAGLGGCPFAAHRGAAGNVCTEDLVFMCDEMGIETGIDLDRLIESAELAEQIVGHPLPGSVMRGGSLARRRAVLREAAGGAA
ncbi:hydroxymethylglutaryl-CoA lyase [Bordetella petrii]|nr:hydroxymethylglutaryl-CoA lyase [Bordetella petrii]